ncbi:integrase, catalytic region, zinc finger, CCHC-type containing protein [Tanacetum coccineum]
MDSIISLGQKNTLAEYMILSGADNRPPMLDKDMYDSWKSRMELYMENREHGRMILESVKNGPLIWPTVEENGVIRTKKYAKLSAAEKIQADCDMKATNIILQGLPTDIYSLVNHHRVAKDLWERVQLLMQGTSLTKQERECKLYDAFDKFTHIKGESLHMYYLRFTQLINDMNTYKMKMEPFQVNTKFLNSLPPEWSKFVTDVKLVKDLHTSNFDQLHAYLKQHELHENEVRIIRERNQDPLAFVANQQMTPPHFNPYQSSYNNPQLQQQFSPSHTFQSQMNHQTSTVPEVIPHVAYQSPQAPTQLMTESPFVDSGFSVPVFSPGDDPIPCLNKAMAFLMDVASLWFPTTNNQLRTSYNLRNQATIQDGRVTVQQVQGRQGQNYSGSLLPIISSELPLIQETKPLFKMAELPYNKFREDKGKIILVLLIRSMLLVQGEILKVDRQELVGLGGVAFARHNVCCDHWGATTAKVKEHMARTMPLSLSETQGKLHDCDDRLDLHKRSMGQPFQLMVSNINLRGKEIVENVVHIPSSNIIAPGMFKLDLELLPPRIQELLVYVQDTCPNALIPSAKKVTVKPMNNVKKVRLTESLTSSSNIKQVESSNTSDSNTHVLSSTGVKNKKNKVEAQPRKVNKVNRVVKPVCDVDVKHSLSKANSEILCATCNKSMFDGVHDKCLLDLVQNGNNHTKSAKKHRKQNVLKPYGSCSLSVDLLSGSRDTNLYTISLDDMLKSSPICLLSKASKTKSWLWHRRLSHLNFDTLNKLSKDGLA